MLAPVNSKAISVATKLLVGPPLPDRFRTRCRKKRNTMAFQVWVGGGVGLTVYLRKNAVFSKLQITGRHGSKKSHSAVEE